MSGRQCPPEIPAISGYSALRDALLQGIDEMFAVENVPRNLCTELKEKVRMNAFNLVVVGQFKRGKTSLINALLGADILPVAVVPLTSIVTIIAYGATLTIKVFFNEGRTLDINPEDLTDYVTEKGNPKNIKDVREVIITYPSPYLKDGVRLIDTPGVGSIYQHNTDVAYQYLPKSDAALFLLSVDQPMSRAELDFLGDVKEYSNKIFFLLNKADYFSESDLKESIEFSRGVLEDAMGADVTIFPVSAKLALDGKLNCSDEVLQKSCLPGFSDVLNAFLMEEKGKILIVSVTNNLLRTISHVQFELALELKSLTTPLEDLERKLQAFETKKTEVAQEKQDFNFLLDGETKMLTKNTLDEDLKVFRRDLIDQEQVQLEGQFSKLKTLPSRELRDKLEEIVIDHVKQAFNAWRAIEDDRLAKAFETICRRFIIKIDDTVDALLKFSSDLFEIPFEALKAETLWTMDSGFYYRFKEQPVGIAIATSTLTLALPKFIGDKIILKNMKDYLVRVADLQAGRIGYDFEKRLDKSKLDFRWEMLQRIEATITGIAGAIEKGMNRRSKGEKEVEERKGVLAEISGRLDNIKRRLLYIRGIADEIGSD